MKTNGDYIISGGLEGRNRLGILSEILYPYTMPLLMANGVGKGSSFLDVGCGGGHVSLMAAKIAGSAGAVSAIDFDAEIIALNIQDAVTNKVTNVSYQLMSAYDMSFENRFDVAYSRFLLSHLQDPVRVLRNMLQSVKPGGRIIVEDIEFSGHFCYPACPAFDRYIELFSTAARQRGQNPDIGPSLYALFREAGIGELQFDVIQPAFDKGAGKWMAWITMDRIKDAVQQQGLADAAAITAILDDIAAFTKEEDTIISLPRIFRVWGIKK